MSRRKFTAGLIALMLLISLPSLSQLPNVAKANPWFIFTQTEPLEGTVPPIINILSPKNNTAYSSDTVLFSFTVTGPKPPVDLPIGFRVINYYLDDNYTVLEYSIKIDSNSTQGVPQYTYSANLTLPKGGHYITVDADGVVFPGNLTIFDVGSSSTVIFSTQPDASTTPFPISDANCIKILSPLPANYSCNGTAIDIPLTVGIDGTFSWMQYFLGDTGWWPYTQPTLRHVNITGNTTLQNIPIGSYVLTVNVNNTFTYATLVFNVTDSDPNAIPPTINPTPTAPTITPTQTALPTATETPITSELVVSPNPLPSNSPSELQPNSTSSPTIASSQQLQVSPEPKEPTIWFLQPFYLVVGIVCVVVAVAVLVVALKRSKQTPNNKGSQV